MHSSKRGNEATVYLVRSGMLRYATRNRYPSYNIDYFFDGVDRDLAARYRR